MLVLTVVMMVVVVVIVMMMVTVMMMVMGHHIQSIRALSTLKVYIYECKIVYAPNI